MKLVKVLTAFVFLAFAATAQTVVQQPSFKREMPVKALGTFMNVKSDGEHADGYEVELWKQGEQIFGLISAHGGLIGDPPAGLLENVRFDPQTGKFSFTAKLSLGMRADNKPSEDLFVFEGRLNNLRLAGSLAITEQKCGAVCTQRKRINLPRSKESSREMSEYQNYAEWKTAADQILDFRGPRW